MKSISALVLLFLTAIPPLLAEEIPPEYLPALDKAYQTRKQDIKNLQAKIDSAQSELSKFDAYTPVKDRPTIGKARREKIAELKKQIHALEESNQLKLQPIDPQLGDIGYIGGENSIIERIERDALIIRYSYLQQDTYATDGSGAITKDNLCTRLERITARIRVLMPAPKGARIGDQIDLPSVVRVKTVGQPSTVEPIDFNPVSRYAKQFLDQKRAADKKPMH